MRRLASSPPSFPSPYIITTFVARGSLFTFGPSHLDFAVKQAKALTISAIVTQPEEFMVKDFNPKSQYSADCL